MKYSDRQSLAPENTPSLSPQLFDRLRALIFDHSGIYYQDNKIHLLQSRLHRRLEELRFWTFDEYYDYLKTPGNRAEIPLMLNAVTTNETCFFRAPEQVHLIMHFLLPRLIERLTGREENRLNLWSAACSTGDEPYTLALALNEFVMPNHPNLDIRITGSDIDSYALTRAKAGLFSARALQSVPRWMIEKYFIKNPGGFQVTDALRKKVVFKHINLASRIDTMGILGMDLVLCANVLIYFPPPVKEQVITSIYNSLNPGGYLLISPRETLFGLGHPFKQVRAGRLVAYQKPE